MRPLSHRLLKKLFPTILNRLGWLLKNNFAELERGLWLVTASHITTKQSGLYFERRLIRRQLFTFSIRTPLSLLDSVT